MSNPEVIRVIEEAWLARAAARGYGKPSSAKYKNMEAEFFIGAMAALNARDPDADPSKMSSAVPPKWVVCLMSGRNIVEVK